MQDALGRKAIHAALRPLTNICSAGSFDFETERALRVQCPLRGHPALVRFRSPTDIATLACEARENATSDVMLACRSLLIAEPEPPEN
jgi:hypothetical protein